MQIFGLVTLNLHILESFFNSISLRIKFYASTGKIMAKYVLLSQCITKKASDEKFSRTFPMLITVMQIITIFACVKILTSFLAKSK